MITLLMSNGMLAFASSAESKTEYSTEDVYDVAEGEVNEEIALKYIELGKAVSKRRATTVLSGFKNLRQSDSRWGNEVMKSEGKTISSAGCALTSFTMVQQFYGGTDNPKHVNAKMGTGACPFSWSLAASKYGYKYNSTESAANLKNYTYYIQGAISSRNPVIVGMKAAGGKQHFVVAYGFDGNNIIISDPASRNYQYLSQYINEGYWVYRMVTYFK